MYGMIWGIFPGGGSRIETTLVKLLLRTIINSTNLVGLAHLAADVFAVFQYPILWRARLASICLHIELCDASPDFCFPAAAVRGFSRSFGAL